MTVRVDVWPYYEWLGTTYKQRPLSADLADGSFYRRSRGEPIYKMDWDDFALFEPKPWIMQPGDLGL